MKSRLQKINHLLLVGMIIALFLGLHSSDYTRARFSDKATVSGITMQMADFSIDLDFEGGTGEFKPQDKAESMQPGKRGELNGIFPLENNSDIPLEYEPYVEKRGGDDELCNLLKLKADKRGKDKMSFEGELMDFGFDEPAELEKGKKDNWQMKLSLPEDLSDEFKEETCRFVIIFSASQTNLDSGGFVDKVVIEEEITVAESFHPGRGEAGQLNDKPSTDLSEEVDDKGDEKDNQDNDSEKNDNDESDSDDPDNGDDSDMDDDSDNDPGDDVDNGNGDDEDNKNGDDGDTDGNDESDSDDPDNGDDSDMDDGSNDAPSDVDNGDDEEDNSDEDDNDNNDNNKDSNDSENGDDDNNDKNDNDDE